MVQSAKINVLTGVIEYIDTETERSAEELLQLSSEYRLHRNRLIAETDWILLEDVNISNKADWLTYRQNLRDLTNQPGFPTDIIWPEKPSSF